MRKHILHPTDSSPSAEAAFARALETARREHGELILVHVIQSARRRCLILYYYFIDWEFGLILNSGAKTTTESPWWPQRDSNPCLVAVMFSSHLSSGFRSRGRAQGDATKTCRPKVL